MLTFTTNKTDFKSLANLGGASPTKLGALDETTRCSAKQSSFQIFSQLVVKITALLFGFVNHLRALNSNLFHA